MESEFEIQLSDTFHHRREIEGGTRIRDLEKLNPRRREETETSS